jgi:hypothetical protein
LALETIERRLSESTAGSKAVSTVGSSDSSSASDKKTAPARISGDADSIMGELSIKEIEQWFAAAAAASSDIDHARETTVRRWLKEKVLKGKTEKDLLEFVNSDWYLTRKSRK